ncbi:MAG: sulfur carrier protein ThiS [Candidatus Carbobacillus altaicus]|nr:sulfur carrier protein ThiS [Candidatus Carbobacillus altaicus]
MALVVNGKREQLPVLGSLEALLQHYGLNRQIVMVEKNGSIIPREAFAQTELHDGDRLEIVHFVGGG